MSITNIDLVSDSLREIAIISEIATASAEQYAHAQRKMNQMMAEWEEAGLRLDYFPQTISSDICPIPAYAENGVMCQLALRLAPNYGAGAIISEALIAAAQSGYDTICRTAVSAALPVNTLLNRPAGAGNYGWPGSTNILLG